MTQHNVTLNNGELEKMMMEKVRAAMKEQSLDITASGDTTEYIKKNMSDDETFAEKMAEMAEREDCTEELIIHLVNEYV